MLINPRVITSKEAIQKFGTWKSKCCLSRLCSRAQIIEIQGEGEHARLLCRNRRCRERQTQQTSLVQVAALCDQLYHIDPRFDDTPLHGIYTKFLIRRISQKNYSPAQVAQVAGLLSRRPQLIHRDIFRSELCELFTIAMNNNQWRSSCELFPLLDVDARKK